MGLSPSEWKKFYRDERAALGEDAMREMIERAPDVTLARGRALIFPHTRLAVTGAQVGAVVKAIFASRAEEVLAIGVLHGGKSVEEEFSLDAFDALLAIGEKIFGRAAPRVRRAFPSSPAEDLGAINVPIVATADLLHHGIGYGRDATHSLDERSARAVAFTRDSIASQMRLLATHDFVAFEEECTRVRSDFRKSGPVLARAMQRDFSHRVIDLELVDYASALGAKSPTWVAGALVELSHRGRDAAVQ